MNRYKLRKKEFRVPPSVVYSGAAKREAINHIIAVSQTRLLDEDCNEPVVFVNTLPLVAIEVLYLAAELQYRIYDNVPIEDQSGNRIHKSMLHKSIVLAEKARYLNRWPSTLDLSVMDGCNIY